MKVLLVLEATLGGTSRHILDLSSGLLQRGDDVHLVYSTLRADEGFCAGLRYLSTTWSNFWHHPIPMRRGPGISDVFSYLRLKRYIRNHGPFDVIHAHSTKAGFLTRLQSIPRSASVFYTPHGLMTMNPKLKGLPRRAVRALESTLARRTDAVIAVSSVERDCALKTGIDRLRLTVIPNGIQQVPPEIRRNQREEIRAALGLSQDVVCIGSVGRLVQYKEPGRVIQAFSGLRRQTSRCVRLVMIGWGPLLPELKRQVAELGLSRDVLFPGEVDGFRHMPAFDMLIHASRFEAFGYVLIEALSTGLPVVTTRVGAAHDLVREGVTGYICDPWDLAVCSSRLRLLVDDSNLRSAMSEAACKIAAQYSVTNMVDSITRLYSDFHSEVSPISIRQISYQDSPGNLQ